MDFMGLLVDEGILIAAGLYIIGIFLKKAPFIPDWLIPFILLALGVISAGFSMNGGFVINNILQGIFAAGAAVLANQIKKQTTIQDVGAAFSSRIEQAQKRPVDNAETESADEEDQNSKGGA